MSTLTAQPVVKTEKFEENEEVSELVDDVQRITLEGKLEDTQAKPSSSSPDGIAWRPPFPLPIVWFVG